MTSSNNLSTQRTSAKARAVRSLSSFTRPADAAIYAVNDTVSESTGDPSVIQFDGVGVAGLVRGATLTMGETDTSDFDLLLFDAEPTNPVDNAALAMVAADIDKLVGVYSFADANKTNVGTALEVYQAAALDPRAYVSTDGKLFGVLVTRTGYTPAASAKFTLALHIEATE